MAKGSETAGYTNSIVTTLKNAGFYDSSNLIDPIFGTDNYYIGLCTSTNAYNVFVKLEQTEYNAPTSTVANTCGGTDAVANGFAFVGATTGGNAGGVGTSNGVVGSGAVGASEVGSAIDYPGYFIKSLTVLGMLGNASMAISPNFSPNIYNYITATSKGKVSIIATLFDPNLQFKIGGIYYPSGATSFMITLSGKTTVKIEVSDGFFTSTYNVTIN